MQVFNGFYYHIEEGEDGFQIIVSDVEYFDKTGHLNDDIGAPHIKLIEMMAGIHEVQDCVFEPDDDGLFAYDLHVVMKKLGFRSSESFSSFLGE